MTWRIPVATRPCFPLFFHACFWCAKANEEHHIKQKDLDGLCRHLMVQDTTAEDVPYVGGITADGDEVVPADVNSPLPGGALPTIIRIPLLMNGTPFFGSFMQKNPSNVQDLTVLGDGEVGVVLYNTQTKTMTLNGHPLTTAQEGALQTICRQKDRQPTNAPP